MDKTEAERILAALKAGTPRIDRHKAAEALEWAMGPRWISVDERMPKDHTLVLVWCDFAVIGERINGRWELENSQGRIFHVTHWQPLPAGPGGAR